MRINQSGIDLIKSFEGCKLKAYKDIAGVFTVGYGHTGDDVYEGLEISQDRADELLLNDLENFEYGVEDLVKVPLNSNQFSALVVFAFNVGLAALYRSRLLKYVNDNKFSEASCEFGRWNKSRGQSIPGLTRRRRAEADLFRQPV